MKLLILTFTSVFISLSQEIPNFKPSKSLDYRKQGLVTEVKNQQDCDVSWAFGLIGVIEGQYAKIKGELVDLSVQEVVDCFEQCGGCRHCDGWTAVNILAGYNIHSEKDYPYKGYKQRCFYKPDKCLVGLGRFSFFNGSTEDEIKSFLEKTGPLYIEVDGDGLKGFSGSGILDNCPYKDANQGVLLIGYGSENGEDYWLIKSSWGTSWGDRGFAKIRRGVNACGLQNNMVVSFGVHIIE